MATQSGQKILRVGVIQNDRVIEERIFRARESVSIGQGFKNTLVIPVAEAPASFVLFDVKGGRYILRYTDKMSGRLSTGQSTTSLEELRKSGKAKVSGSTASIELPEISRGKIVVGEVTFLFQFVNPPPLRVLPQLPANMRGGFLQFMGSIMGLSGAFIAALLFSFVLQFGFALYLVLLVPPPPRARLIDQDTITTRPDWVDPDEPEERDEEPEDGDDAIPEEPAEVVAEAPREPEPQEPVAEREPREREEARELVERAPLAAVFMNADGGVDTGWDAVDRVGALSADELMAERTQRGEGGLETTLGGARPGVPTGTRAEVQEIEGQPGAPQVEGRPSRGPEVVGRVSAGAAETAGRGTLDASEIQRAMRRNQRRIQACYQRALNENPGLSGRLTVRFEIGTDGRVARVNIVGNTLGEQVGRCVEGEVRRWRFTAPEGGSVWVQNPYVFSSGDR